MSLARLGMRIAAARALKGATLAEDRVFDSIIDPFSLTGPEGGGEPAVTVTTDDHAVETDGRDLTGGDARCDLVIECVIASKVTTAGDDGGQQVSIAIPHTDEGMELVLDLMEAQVIRALAGGDGTWPEVWRHMVPRVMRRNSRRGASNENGARFAARQIVISCDLVSDPVLGQEPSPESAFGALLAAMDGDAALAQVAQVIRAQIVDSSRSEWQQIGDMLGITDRDLSAIGLGAEIEPPEDPATLTEITLQPSGDVIASEE